MPVKIRLQRRGRRKRPFYHIVIADARAPRDGKFIEKIGTYNPMTVPATIELDRDSAYNWLMKGAQPTDTVRAILRYKGVLYRKHLQRGVAKGALTQEEADSKFEDWIAEKEGTVAERRAAQEQKEAEFRAQVSGTPPPPPEPEPEPAAVEDDATTVATADDTTPPSATSELDAARAEAEGAGSTPESVAAAADVAGEAEAEADSAEAAGAALATATEGENDDATGNIDKEV